MVNIDIVSGFLGAGKTTLINKLLGEAYLAEKPILIENEFGDVSVDDALIQDHEVKVKLLPSGCICCTLKGDFIQGIAEVVNQYRPSCILIEPTGLANPADLLSACAEAAKAVEVEVSTLMTIVNAQNLLALLEISGDLFTKQIADAEIIVLSCVQFMNANELLQVKQAIRALNRNCILLDANWADLDSTSLLLLAQEARAQKSKAVCPDCGHSHTHEHACCSHAHVSGHDREHESASGFSALAFFPQHDYTLREAQELLTVLKGSTFGQVLRAKGFLRSANGGYFHVEYVYGREEIQDWDNAATAKFVVIGSKLQEHILSELMHKE